MVRDDLHARTQVVCELPQQSIELLDRLLIFVGELVDSAFVVAIRQSRATGRPLLPFQQSGQGYDGGDLVACG